MKRIKFLALTVLILMCTIPISASRFVNKTGEQTKSYVGLGNKNEDLAFAYYTNQTKGAKQISFTLYGTVANISTLKVYARPYSFTNGDNRSGLSVTDQQIWDYRDPIGKSGAILLASIDNIPAAGTITNVTTDGTLSTGSYMIYLTADIKGDVDLPFLTKEKTYIGGVINKFDNNRISTSLVNNGKSRIFVYKRQLLYAPGDYYSKYYRIPSITKASDGSLVAISDARKYHIHDIQNDIDILCRRSLDNGKTWGDPITIAQAKNTKYGPDYATGYGDAALAALPNGDLICTMISGASLGESNSSNYTTNWYTISHDNGQTWGELQQISPKLYDSKRGCIAPGNMCVIKSGILKGKVLACFRSYDNGVTDDMVLIYDPDTSTWSYLTVGGTKYFASGTDEGHIVELGENNLLVSLRGGTGNRTFKKLTISKNRKGVISAKSSYISSNMSLVIACNGDIIPYTDEYGNKYLLQTVPSKSATDSNGNNTRSNQTIYTVKNLSQNASSISWTECLGISDPFNDKAETAQYSSMTVQNDNTLGIIEEEYPDVVRHDETNGRGDFLLCSWYLNVRIEDIISGAKTPATAKLTAPEISPKSTSYNSEDNSIPNIVITNTNSLEGTSTHYDMYVYSKGSDEGKCSQSGDFATTSKKLSWPNEINSDGTMVKIVAYCSKTGHDNSSSNMQQYTFTISPRNIKLVVMPLDGAGNPTLTVAGVGQYNAFNTMNVAEGKKVTINAPGDNVYNFQKFTYDKSGNVPLSSKISVTSDNINNYQISFNLPNKTTLPNNDADTLAIYVWYNSETNYGIMSDTYVYTGAESNYSGYTPESPSFDSHYQSFWCTSSTETTWPYNINANLDFGNASKSTNEVSNIKFPQKKDNTSSFRYGIDACVRVLPDNGTAHNLNGVVMIKKNGEFLRDNGKYVYYLLNGVGSPYAKSTTIYKDAKKVMNWYQYSQSGTKAIKDDSAIPAKISDCTFVVSKDNESLDSFDAMIYVVKGDLTSVDALIQDLGYLYKIEHIGQKSDIPTSATLSKSNGISIIGGTGEVLVSCTTPTLVVIYNTLGIRVASVNVEGSTSISLPCGIYIANGKKFIVK